MAKTVHIIAGANGAGKTTFAREFLPHYADCRNFINADLIAQGIAPFSPESVAVRAGRMMLNEIHLHADRGDDFGFETTLAGRTYLSLIQDLRNRDYRINFYYLWVPDAQLLLSRIRGRVRSGGHDVPTDVVLRRFGRSARNFLVQYRHLGNSWFLFDNSLQAPEAIAFEQNRRLRILRKELYAELLDRYGMR